MAQPVVDLPPLGTKERAAVLARQRRRRRARGVLGPFDRVPVFAVRHVIKSLFDAGFTYTRIEAVSGVDKDRLVDIMCREGKLFVNYETHQRFCALDIEALIASRRPRLRNRRSTMTT